MASRPQRDAFTTILVVVEGETELALCLHLKSRLSRGIGARITVECAHGGGPLQVLQSTEHFMRYADYDYSYAMFDSDVPMCDECSELIQQIKVKCMILEPCLEGWLLRVLGLNSPRSTTACKTRFHRSVLAKKKKVEQSNYRDLLSDALLKNRESIDPLLKQLVEIFTNQID